MIEKVQINIDVLLPGVPDAKDACVRRLGDLLRARKGVDAAHLERREGAPERLCVHYDPQLVSLGEIRDFAARAGATLSDQYGHLSVETAPMQVRKARRVASQLSRVEGVIEAAVAPEGVVRVEFDRRLTSAAGITANIDAIAGVSAPGHGEGQPAREPGERHAHGGALGERAELVFGALSGALLLVGWVSSTFFTWPAWAPLTLLVSAYFFGAFFTVREAVSSIRMGRFEIDFLMLVAAGGAAALGEWAEGALLLFLFSLGHALEGYAMGRAKRAIQALGDLAPQRALVRRNDQVSEVSVDDVLVGDVVLVKPNERVAADGFVILGESSVNQAPITGESVPVDKRPVGDRSEAAAQPDAVSDASRVFAGTINGNGAIEIQVTRKSGDSTLARVIRMVNEAETNQSPTQRLTDRFERIFVPVVLTGAVLLLFAWVVVDEPFSVSFYRAMAVLVAASPCALAIATPSAVLSGVARAARGGVLVKGGAPLENLGRIRAMAFDKTGTLTEGEPRLVDVEPGTGVTEVALLRVAVGAEALSDHPLASAVVRDGGKRLGDAAPATASNLRSITGRGLQADVDGRATFIGNDHLFSEIDGTPPPAALLARVEELEKQGRTTMIVRHGDQYLGVLGLMDSPRPAAARVIERLRRIGMRRIIMLSGDNQRVADAVGREVGVDEARGELMPDDKVATIVQLRAEAKVAMVGDGVNDAPAMANATVGIAMGAAGSDTALETADVALMADDLEHLPFAIALSRAASRVIRQNLWLSLGVVVLLVPATIVGLGIGPAVAVHEGSTLLVVFNALRLLAFDDRDGVPGPDSAAVAA